MNQILKAESIIYQDSSLFVINKPSGIHCLPQGDKKISLAEELRSFFKDNLGEFSDSPEEALLQRLDFETSGMMLIAKNKKAFDNLKDQFRNHEVVKEYHALVDGQVNQTLSASGYLGSRYRHSQKVSFYDVPKKRFLYAETQYFPIKVLEDKNLSIVKAITSYGRRHQVRVMAGVLAHPLCGDSLYGSKNLTNSLIADYQIPAFILHASSISFKHPDSGMTLTCTGSLPEYLVRLL